jgi:MFS family permease
MSPVKTARKILSPYKGLPFSVYILFLARIINRMGDFVNFFLALYLTTYLGFDEKKTGLVISLVGASMTAGTLAGGRLTDTRGRKRLLMAAQSLSAFSIILCGFIPDSPSIILLILLFIFFNGAARPINTALLTDLTREEERPAAFSLLYLGINIGVSLGPLLAGFLFNSHRRWLFWGDGGTTLFSLILIFLFIREPSGSGNTDEQRAHESYREGSSFKALRGNPLLIRFLPLSLLSAFIYSQHAFALPLQLNQLFSDESPRIFGIIMSLNAVTVLALTPVLNHLLRKRPPLRQISLGMLFYGAGFGILALSLPRTFLFYASTVLWTAGEVLDAVNSGVFVANRSPINHRGRFSSLFLMTKGIGRSLSPLLSGLIISFGGTAPLWVFILILSLFLYLALTRLNRRFA